MTVTVARWILATAVATNATARARNSASVAVLNLNTGNSGGCNSASVAVLNHQHSTHTVHFAGSFTTQE
jgi:hypothetical protein